MEMRRRFMKEKLLTPPNICTMLGSWELSDFTDPALTLPFIFFIHSAE